MKIKIRNKDFPPHSAKIMQKRTGCKEDSLMKTLQEMIFWGSDSKCLLDTGTETSIDWNYLKIKYILFIGSPFHAVLYLWLLLLLSGTKGNAAVLSYNYIFHTGTVDVPWKIKIRTKELVFRTSCLFFSPHYFISDSTWMCSSWVTSKPD